MQYKYNELFSDKLGDAFVEQMGEEEALQMIEAVSNPTGDGYLEAIDLEIEQFDLLIANGYVMEFQDIGYNNEQAAMMYIYFGTDKANEILTAISGSPETDITAYTQAYNEIDQAVEELNLAEYTERDFVKAMQSINLGGTIEDFDLLYWSDFINLLTEYEEQQVQSETVEDDIDAYTTVPEKETSESRNTTSAGFIFIWPIVAIIALSVISTKNKKRKRQMHDYDRRNYRR